MNALELIPVPGMPEVAEGDSLGALIGRAAGQARLRLGRGDVVAVSQKVVSKAEGRVVGLASVEPGQAARELASRVEKDARLVHLVLGEAARVVRAERGAFIVETRGGWVCANAGIDASNVAREGTVTLLPVDADVSARTIRAQIADACGERPAVLVTDSFGRPWRLGQADVAIGCAGLEPLDDWRGRRDRAGRELTATMPAIADQVAAAADLARDKASGTPVVLVRGLGRYVGDEDGPGARALRRPAAQDLFR